MSTLKKGSKSDSLIQESKEKHQCVVRMQRVLDSERCRGKTVRSHKGLERRRNSSLSTGSGKNRTQMEKDS